mmetsp:Transcript_67277/g.109071  ORF Transcript_67277/g.109071 Transcript_67277/m.109071 type:complete len:107 (+) Transcript_67277:1-321(+)
MSAKVTECTRAARPHVCDSLWFVLHQDALVGYGQCMQSVSVDGIGMPTSMSRAFHCLCLKEAPSPYKEAPSRYPNLSVTAHFKKVYVCEVARGTCALDDLRIHTDG